MARRSDCDRCDVAGQGSDHRVLVDTSVWIDHLRRGNHALALRLEQGLIECHPFVIGELACGTLNRRAEILSLLAELPQLPQIDHDDMLVFVESNRIMGRGLGWVDMHLLAAAHLAGTALWTLDSRLATMAHRLGLDAAT